jgi:GntR family transcriptional regulator
MAHSTLLSQRLHLQLGELIAELSPGERLPSEPKLSKEFGVSRATLREAMRTFETQGMIQRRQGVGTFAVHPSGVMDAGIEILESVETLADRIGLPVRMGKFDSQRRAATDDEKFLLGEDSVLQVSRAIEAENRPVAYLEDILPDSLITDEEFFIRFTGSILDLLLKRGEPKLASSKTEIQAVAASSKVARALHIQRSDVILYMQATLYSIAGEAIDYSDSYFLPGYFRFQVLRRVGTLDQGIRS